MLSSTLKFFLKVFSAWERERRLGGSGLDLQSHFREDDNCQREQWQLEHVLMSRFFSAEVDRQIPSRVAYEKGFLLLFSETFDLRKPALEYRGQNFLEQYSCQSDLYLNHVHTTCTMYAVFYKQFSSNKIYLKNFGERYPHNPLGSSN